MMTDRDLSPDDPPLAAEADLIALLRPLTRDAPGAFGLRDDCARLTPRPGFDLVLKTDPVRAGVHFFADDPPEDIAWKALAVNISDLAAKGAVPVVYLMAMAFPEVPRRRWMQRFTDGLQTAQDRFRTHLVGGDTDRAPGPLSIAITAIGEVPSGGMVQRGTARAGDALYVSGTLGDAGLGLRLHAETRSGSSTLADQWALPAAERLALVGRYLRPEPRLDLAAAVRAYASAAMDVSDGLVKDLERMCVASGVRATVDASQIRLSGPARRVVAVCPEIFPALLTAGDDYEILAAIPPGRVAAFEAAARQAAAVISRIGTFGEGAGVAVLDRDGAALSFDRRGWDHF